MGIIRSETIMPKRSKKRLYVFVLISILLVLGGGGYAYRQHVLRTDKARFVQAEADIAELTKQITDSVGTPLKTQTEKFCSRPNLKFKEGQLSCNVESIVYNAIENEQEATAYHSKISTLVQQKWHRDDISYSLNMGFEHNYMVIPSDNYLFNRDYQRITELFTNDRSNLKCSSTSTYYKSTSPPSSDYLVINNLAATMMIRIDCSDLTKSLLYKFK